MPLREQRNQHSGYRSVLTDDGLRHLLPYSHKGTARRVRRSRALRVIGSVSGS
ncbi:hypothetical protein GCM10027404_04050 [Arthrobacter tumbae]